MKLSYAEQLKRPEWQKVRLEVLKKADWRCQCCCAEDKQLQVHHRIYIKGRMVWEYEFDNFQCLCEDCHKEITAINESIRKLTNYSRSPELILGIIAGFEHGDPDHNQADLVPIQQANPRAYAAGVVAMLAICLSAKDMEKIGQFIYELAGECHPLRDFMDQHKHILRYGENKKVDE